MAKPLRSADPNPKSIQFSQFGVLDDGHRSKGAMVTSIVINGLILAAILIIGTLIKTNPIMAKKLTELTLPPQPPPPPPIRHPPVMPPKPLPTPPKITVEPPPPVVKLEPPKLTPLPPKPLPPTPAIVKLAPPAPKIVNLGNPKAASVPNHDPNPSPVRLGNPNSPVSPVGPAVGNVNLGRGVQGMPGANNGNGPHSTAVNLGNGLPGGSNMSAHPGNSAVAVKPVTGFGGNGAPPAATRPTVQAVGVASPPKVIYKPTPIYTSEAKAMHLEGNVKVRIKVSAAGAVSVIQVTQGLGHGLDQSAIQAAQGTRFKPAIDNNGQPIDWEGVVIVNFQMS